MSVVLFLFGKNRLLYRYPYHNPFEIEQSKMKQGNEANHKQATGTTVNTHSNINGLPPKGEKLEFVNSMNSIHSSSSNGSIASDGLSVSSKATSNTTNSSNTTTTLTTNNNKNDNITIKYNINNNNNKQSVRMPTSASQESLFNRNDEFFTQPSNEVINANNEKMKTMQHSSSALTLSNNSFGGSSNRFYPNSVDASSEGASNKPSNKSMTTEEQEEEEEEEEEEKCFKKKEQGILWIKENNHYVIENLIHCNNTTWNEEGPPLYTISSSRNTLSSSRFRTPPKVMFTSSFNSREYDENINNNNSKKKNLNKNEKINVKNSNDESTFCIYAENSNNNNNNNNMSINKMEKFYKTHSRNNNDDITTIKHNIFTRLYEDEEIDKAALRELLYTIQHHIQLQQDNNNNINEQKELIEPALNSLPTHEIEEVMTDHSVNDLPSMLRNVGPIRLERPAEVSCIGLSHIALEQLLRATPASCATLHFAHVTLLLYRLVLSNERRLEFPFEELSLEDEELLYDDDINREEPEYEEEGEYAEQTNKQEKQKTHTKKSNKPNQDASSAMLVIALNRGDDAQNSLSSFVQCIVNVLCREELREQYVSREINTIEHTTKLLEFYDDKSNVEVGAEFISSTSSIYTYCNNHTNSVNMKSNMEKIKTRAQKSPKPPSEVNVQQEEKRTSNEQARNATLADEMSSRNVNNTQISTSTSIRTVNMFNFLFLYLRHSVTLLRTCRELVKILDTWMRVLRQVQPSELNMLTRQTLPFPENCINHLSFNKYDGGVKYKMEAVYRALSELPDGLWINRHLYLPLRYLLGYTPSEYTSENNNDKNKNTKKTSSSSSSSSNTELNIIQQHTNNKNKQNKVNVEFQWPHPCISVHICNDLIHECERNTFLEEEETENEESKVQSIEKIQEKDFLEHENGCNNDDDDQDKQIQSRKARSKIVTHKLLASLYEQVVGEWFAKYLPWNTIVTFLLNSNSSFTFGTLYRYLECVLLTNIRNNLYKSKMTKLMKYANAENNKDVNLGSHSAGKRRQHSTSNSLCSPCTNVASTSVLLKGKESQRSSLPNSQLTSPSTNLEQPPQPPPQPSSSSISSLPSFSSTGIQKLKREESCSYKTRHQSKRSMKRKKIWMKKEEIAKEANFTAFQQVVKYSPALTKIGSFLQSHAIIRNEVENTLHVSLSHCELAPLESTVAMYFLDNNHCDKSMNEPLPVIPPLLFLELLQINTSKYNNETDSHETSLALSQHEPLNKSNESANVFTWPGSAEHQLTLPENKNKNKKTSSSKESAATIRTSPYLTSAKSPVSSKRVNIKDNINNNNKVSNFSKFTRDKHASASASVNSNRQVFGISSPLLLPQGQQQQEKQQETKETTFAINVDDVEVQTPLFASPWLDASSPITPLSALMDTKHSSWASYKLPFKLENEWLHKRSEAMNVQLHVEDKQKESIALNLAHQMNLESEINIRNENSNNNNKNNNTCLSKTPEANKWTMESSSVASSQHSWTVTHSWKGIEDATQQPSLHSLDERRVNRECKTTYLHEQDEEEEEYEEEENEKRVKGCDVHERSNTQKSDNVEEHQEKVIKTDESITNEKTVDTDETREKNTINSNEKEYLPKLRVHCVWGEACPFCEALAASALVQLTQPSTSTTITTESENYKSELRAQEIMNTTISTTINTNTNSSANNTKDCIFTSETNIYTEKVEEAVVEIQNTLTKNVQYTWQFPCNRNDRFNAIYVELEFPLLNFNVLNWTRQCALYEYTLMQMSEKGKHGKVVENIHSSNTEAKKSRFFSSNNNNNIIVYSGPSSTTYRKVDNNRSASLNLHPQLSQPITVLPSPVSYGEEKQLEEEELQQLYEWEQPYHSCDLNMYASCEHKERPWFVRPEIYFSTHTSHMYSPLEMYQELLTTSQEHKSHYYKDHIKNKMENDAMHGNHSRESRRHAQSIHSENRFLHEEEEESENELENEGEVHEMLSNDEFKEPMNEKNKTNQMHFKNSQIMRQMHMNWSSSKNGKTGSIDDTELTLWMNTHTDDITDNVRNNNTNNTNKSVKVFIDGITISHEASAWLQRNGPVLRKRLLYEMELAQAIHSMLVICKTQELREIHINNSSNVNDTNKNTNVNELTEQVSHDNVEETQPLSVQSHQNINSQTEMTHINEKVKPSKGICQSKVESKESLSSLPTESSSSEEEEEEEEKYKKEPMTTSASLPSSLLSTLSKSRYLRYNKRQLPHRNVTQCLSPLPLESNAWQTAHQKMINANNHVINKSIPSYSYNSRTIYQNNSNNININIIDKLNSNTNASEVTRQSSTNYLTDTNVSLNVNGSSYNNCHTPLTDTNCSNNNKITIYNLNNSNNDNDNNNKNKYNITENEKHAHDERSGQTTQESISQQVNEQAKKTWTCNSAFVNGNNINNNIKIYEYYSQNKSSPNEQLAKSIGALSTSQWLAHLHLRFLPHDILLQCAIHMTIILLWSHAKVEIEMLQRQLERLLHHLSTLLFELQYVNQLISAGYSSHLAWKIMCEQENDTHNHVKNTRRDANTKRNEVEKNTTMQQFTKTDNGLPHEDNDNNAEKEGKKISKERSAYSSLPPTPSPTSAHTFANTHTSNKNNNAAMTIIPVMSDVFSPSANDVHLLQLYELFDEMCVTELIAPYNGCKLPQIPTPLLLHAIVNEMSDVLSIN